MTQQASAPTAAPTTTPQANGAGIVVREPASSGDGDTSDAFEANLHAMREQIRAEGFSVDGSEDTSGGDEAAPEQPQQAAPAPQQPPAVDAAAERRARLAALHAKNRERVDAMRRNESAEKLARELEETRKRAEELEARTKTYVDPASLDEARFLALAEQSKVSPDALAAFIQSRAQNPERFAAEATQRALDPKLTAAEKRVAELEAMVTSYIQKQEQREQQAAQQRETQEFMHAVSQTDGVAAKYLAAEGPGAFLQIAERAASLLPPGASPQDLYDQIEDLLETDGRAIYESLASIYGPNGSSTAMQPPPNRATAPANTARAPNTVTNQIAQERSSVVNEGEFWQLPFEERLAYLKKHH